MTPEPWPLGGPKHGYNGWVAIMRLDYPDNEKRHSPAWEVLVEIEGIGLVSAWVGEHQRRTPAGEPVWVWARQVTKGGKGDPIIRSMPSATHLPPKPGFGCGKRLGTSTKACGYDGYWCGCKLELVAEGS